MADNTGTTQVRTLPAFWVLAAIATPATAALLIHMKLIWTSIANNPGDTALATGIVVLVASTLTLLAAFIIISTEYFSDGLRRDTNMVALGGHLSLITTLTLAAGATLVAVHEPQHPLSGTSIGLIAGGIITICMSMRIIISESQIRGLPSRPALIRTGQKLAIAGAAAATTGVLIICRSQLGL